MNLCPNALRGELGGGRKVDGGRSFGSGSYTSSAGKKDWGRPNKQHQPPCRTNTADIEEIRQVVKRGRKREKRKTKRENGKKSRDGAAMRGRVAETVACAFNY